MSTSCTTIDRSSRHPALLGLAVVTCFGLAAPRAMAQSGSYSLVDLGVAAEPYAVGPAGTVVGSRSGGASGRVAFRYDIGTGVLEDIVGGVAAHAVGAGDRVVGATAAGAFLDDGVSFSDLGDGHGAFGINGLGIVSGSEAGVNPFRPSPLPVHPALYDASSGRWQVLEVARVYPRGTRQGIYADVYRLEDVNAAGISVGSRRRTGLAGSSVILMPASFDEVVYLPIPNGGSASAINDHGLVVGSTGSGGSEVYPRAFAYDIDADVLIDLGTLAGGLSSGAADVNELDQIVGSSWLVTEPTSIYDPSLYHAFLWEDGGMSDLNSVLPVGSPWILTAARAISDAGEIAGVGLIGGVAHGFVLVPGEVACTDLDGDGYAIDGGTCGEIDCDDGDPAVHPGAAEIPGDGVDNDCDPTTPPSGCQASGT